MKWGDLIETIMHQNRGIASLNLLYEQTSSHRELPNGDWRKTLRGVLYREAKRGRFIKAGLGVYAIPGYENESSAYSFAVRGLSGETYLQRTPDQHSAIEGMLLEVGNFLEYNTYTGDTNKLFDGKQLGDLCTIPQVPDFTYSDLRENIARCDVIWFTRSRLPFPKYVFEVEATTDFTKSMLKMYQLLHFEARFILAAPEKRHSVFLSRIEQEPFALAKQRYAFRSFEGIVKFYFNCVEHYELKNSFLSD